MANEETKMTLKIKNARKVVSVRLRFVDLIPYRGPCSILGVLANKAEYTWRAGYWC